MHSSAPASRISLFGPIKNSIAVVVIGVGGLLLIIQWTAFTVRKHIGIASQNIFPAALDSQRAGTAFERMNRDYSDAVVIQEMADLASADREAATVVSSLDRAAASMAFNPARQQQIVSLEHRIAGLRARSIVLYTAAAKANATPPDQKDLAELAHENSEIGAELEMLDNGLSSDFRAELNLIDTLLGIQGILQAVVLVGVIVALFFSTRTLIKATVQRREDEILRQAHAEQENERQMLRALIDNIPDVVFVKDIDSRYVLTNSYMARIAGEERPESLTGKTEFDFFPEEFARIHFEIEQSVMRSGQPLLDQEERGIEPSRHRLPQ